MLDLWNVPEAVFSADLITARVAEAIEYIFALLQKPRAGKVVVRKHIVRDLGISHDTLKTYMSPVLNENYEMTSGPTKIGLFHKIIYALGISPYRLYEAAETSKSYQEFTGRVGQIVLGDDIPSPGSL